MIAGQLQLVEQLEKPPNANAVSIVAPRVVAMAGRRTLHAQHVTKTTPEREMLDIESDMDREPPAAWPGVVSALGDRRIVVTAVSR